MPNKPPQQSTIAVVNPTITSIAETVEHPAKVPAEFAFGQQQQLLRDLAIIQPFCLVAIDAATDVQQATSLTLAQTEVVDGVGGQPATLVFRHSFYSTTSLSAWC